MSQSAAATTLEKRRDQRLVVNLSAHCRLGDLYVRETLQDISLSGLFIRTGELARPGTPVRIALALPYVDGPRFCTLVGTVVRTVRTDGSAPGLGVAFDDSLDRFDKNLLKGFIALWSSRRVGRA